MRQARAALRTALLVSLFALGVGPACSRGPDTLIVLAAASLSPSFRALAQELERQRPEARVRVSVAGSQILAAQLRAGAPADVVAFAHPELLTALASEGLVRAPGAFAANRMVLVLQKSVPVPTQAQLVAELRERPLRWLLAAPEVPAGRYAREALAKLELSDAIEPRLVSRELDVSAVLAKLRLGLAEAAIVYASDVWRLQDPALQVLELPRGAQVRALYAIAQTTRSDSPHAQAFVELVVGPAGQSILREHGFGPVS